MSYFDFGNTEPKKKGKPEKYPFSTLEVGESFEIPDGTRIQSLRALAYQRGVNSNKVFSVSKLKMKVERIL